MPERENGEIEKDRERREGESGGTNKERGGGGEIKRESKRVRRGREGERKWGDSFKHIEGFHLNN